MGHINYKETLWTRTLSWSSLIINSFVKTDWTLGMTGSKSTQTRCVSIAHLDFTFMLLAHVWSLWLRKYITVYPQFICLTVIAYSSVDFSYFILRQSQDYAYPLMYVSFLEHSCFPLYWSACLTQEFLYCPKVKVFHWKWRMVATCKQRDGRMTCQLSEATCKWWHAWVVLAILHLLQNKWMRCSSSSIESSDPAWERVPGCMAGTN